VTYDEERSKGVEEARQADIKTPWRDRGVDGHRPPQGDRVV
jgi:hypothetical protein